MKRITIIGLGLIGGSLGLALKKALGTEIEVTGHARKGEVARLALEKQAVDKTEAGLASAVKTAEMVIIATPVLAMRDILKRIAPELAAGCIVTDAASTKAAVLEWAEQYLPQNVNFVGGHPMAGKETFGIEAADATLFQGCTYCLTPARSASRESMHRLKWMAETVGAKPMFLSAADHDYMVAGISHLPLVISTALVSSVTRSNNWPTMSKLASTGFRDVTRLASGNTEMSRDICLTNRDSLVRWIDDYMMELRKYRDAVSEGNPDIEAAFARARETRQEWLKKRFGLG